MAWFTDPAGGSGGDSYTLAGAAPTSDGKVAIVFLCERKPPFSADDVTREFAEVIKRYGGTTVRGDRWGGEWPRERFRRSGISYEVSESTKSQIHQDAVPLLTAAKIELPDNPRLIAQLCALERRVARGRDSIDHPPRGYDDLANCALGAALAATLYRRAGSGTARITGIVGGSVQHGRRPAMPLPPVEVKPPGPWTYDSLLACPLPAHRRRTR